jgi:hypothetical protein
MTSAPPALYAADCFLFAPILRARFTGGCYWNNTGFMRNVIETVRVTAV